MPLRVSKWQALSMIRDTSIKLFLLFFLSLIFSQSQSPYLDIANELMVRQKLSTKLPDIFDNSKFTEVANKLDNIIFKIDCSHLRIKNISVDI